jgi:hypothetical protein
MSDQEQRPNNADLITETDIAADDADGGLPIQRYLLIGLGGFIGLVVIGLLIALIGGTVNSDGFANFFRILRDFFIIALALLGILMCIALMILVMQVSALVNLIRQEIKPIMAETRETLATVRGTTTFISQNVTQPVIRATAFVAGTRSLVGDLLGLRRNLRPRKK